MSKLADLGIFGLSIQANWLVISCRVGVKPIETFVPFWAICSSSNRSRKEGIFYLTTHSTHFIYGYMASHIW